MYIFKYINKNTGELIGYHLSTFCQVGKKEQAKRYQCTDGPEAQMEIIRKNLKSTLETKDTDKGMNDFKCLSYDEVELEAEYLIDGITPDDIEHRVHTIVHNGEVHKVDAPIEDVTKIVVEIYQSKHN